MKYLRAIKYIIKYSFLLFLKNIFKIFFKSHNLSEKELFILGELEKNGYYFGTNEDLKDLKIKSDWKQESEELCKLLDRQHQNQKIDQNRKGSINIMLNEIPDNIITKLYTFALNESFIKIIENYLNLKLLFRGVAIKKDLIDGREIETRKWHIDGEDNRIIKIIFYLNSVDENGGPFTCIPKKKFFNQKIRKDKNGRIENETIKEYFKDNEIIKFIGDIKNFIIVDTCSVLHKGELPITNNRYITFFCYNSIIPTQPEYCKNLNPSFYNKFKGKLKRKITPIA